MNARGGAAAAVLLVLAGCGGTGDQAERPVTVFAAASLTDVLDELEPDARFNFAGSDELARQLREGATADVYASASARHARELYEEGLVERPVAFATNRLVLVVPADNPAGIESLADAARAGTRIVVGAEGVPVGDYTRRLLERLGRQAVLARVVSEERDVKGVLGKVALGEADAGFVYATDARVAAGRVRALDLPADGQEPIRYEVAVVSGSERPQQAEAFVRLLLGPEGRAALERASFGTP